MIAEHDDCFEIQLLIKQQGLTEQIADQFGISFEDLTMLADELASTGQRNSDE